MAEMGDFVVCIDDGPGHNRTPSGLTRGVVYTVDRVTGDGRGVIIVEAILPPYFDAWDASRFRPVRADALAVFRTAEARVLVEDPTQ